MNKPFYNHQCNDIYPHLFSWGMKANCGAWHILSHSPSLFAQHVSSTEPEPEPEASTTSSVSTYIYSCLSQYPSKWWQCKGEIICFKQTNKKAKWYHYIPRCLTVTSWLSVEIYSSFHIHSSSYLPIEVDKTTSFIMKADQNILFGLYLFYPLIVHTQ